MTNGARARRYIGKQKLLGIDELVIDIESEDVVRLVGVNYDDTNRVLRIPSFINVIEINYMRG